MTFPLELAEGEGEPAPSFCNFLVSPKRHCSNVKCPSTRLALGPRKRVRFEVRKSSYDVPNSDGVEVGVR